MTCLFTKIFKRVLSAFFKAKAIYPLQVNNMIQRTNNDFPETEVTSVEQYVKCVLEDTKKWQLIPGCSPWFRGQADGSKPPLPGIMRYGVGINEREIVQRFQKLAPMFGNTPPRELRDEWLYLMQHVGVPTRLLDWSEGALIGLYFAVQGNDRKSDPGVWVLHPIELNRATLELEIFPDAKHRAFVARCDLAFKESEAAPGEIRWPIAIIPTYTHPRMKSQRGCFTLHGSRKFNFEEIAYQTKLLDKGFFKKYRIPSECTGKMLRDLRLFGITHSTLFPDHDGLATDLKNAFREEREL